LIKSGGFLGFGVFGFFWVFGVKHRRSRY